MIQNDRPRPSVYRFLGQMLPYSWRSDLRRGLISSIGEVGSVTRTIFELGMQFEREGGKL